MGYMTVKSLPFFERPYEKLQEKGASSLSDAELLAIILKNGSKNERATDLAYRILATNGDGFLSLHSKSIQELMQFKGVGKVKAIQLKALAEISNRMYKQKHIKLLDANSPRTVADYYMEVLRHLEKERVIMLSLNTKNQVLKEDIVSIGNINSSIIDAREAFKLALKNNAKKIILLHNHPSGNPTPSLQDINLSKEILNAGKLIGISLIDHIIIGDCDYYSLSEKGII